MPNHLLFNFTVDPLNNLINTCFEWCQNQSVIHQSNIDIGNLGVIAIAMIMLLIYNLSIEWEDWILENSSIDKYTLRFWGHIIVYFAFMLLAVFLGYYAFFN